MTQRVPGRCFGGSKFSSDFQDTTLLEPCFQGSPNRKASHSEILKEKFIDAAWITTSWFASLCLNFS